MAATSTAELRSWGIALIRFAVGLVFVAHGTQKVFVYGHPGVTGAFGKMGIPAPAATAWVVMAVEFLGGLALMLGLFTRVAAILLAINMAGAVLLVHLKNGFFLPTGFEYAFALMLINIGLVLTGPGAFALDNVLPRRTLVREGLPRAA